MNLDLRRVCQGSTNVSLLLDFLEMVPKKRFFQNYPPSPQWNPDAILKLPGRPRWVKHLKTWWKLGENAFQNLVKNWRKPWWISNTWWISKTWWKPGEFKKFSPKEQRHKEAFYTSKSLQKTCSFFLRFTVMFGLNLVKFQNLVNTCWRPGEFPKPPRWISGTWCYETFWQANIAI